MFRLSVTGEPSAAILLRVVNLISQHDLAFRSLEGDLVDDTMRIRIDLPSPPSEALVERIRSLVEVAEVELAMLPLDVCALEQAG